MNARPDNSRRGFTLIEVMISIAIVLALILGINQVFKVAAQTVSTGHALGAKTRDARAAHAVFYNEIGHMVPPSEAPFLIIDSRTQVAYMNRSDELSDTDGNIWTRDMDSNNVEGEAAVLGETFSPASVNDRAHRVDSLSFFARDMYRRQTGNNTPPPAGASVYIADQSSNEAWITYGHLRIFDQSAPANVDVDTDYVAPGVGTNQTNPKNRYASDWVLGRMAMLMVAPTDPDGDGFDQRMTDRAGAWQSYWQRQPATLGYVLTPFAKNTVAGQENTASTITITDARYDLVGRSIDQFRADMSAYQTVLASGAPPAGYRQDWFNYLAFAPGDPPPAGPLPAMPPGRFRSNPYPFKPMTARKAAQTANAMLANCSQFIVEYAGDFLTQEVNDADGDGIWGEVTALGPDGTVDFYYEPTTGVPAPGVRRTRWYGFPRDIGGGGNGGPNGIITGWQAGISPNALVDVVPLRDVARTLSGAAFLGFSFEKCVYNPPAGGPIEAMPVRNNYAAPNQDAANGIAAGSGVNELNHYICAWGPNDQIKPKMLRIIMRIDDPNGKLPDGQTFEYTINLP